MTLRSELLDRSYMQRRLINAMDDLKVNDDLMRSVKTLRTELSNSNMVRTVSIRPEVGRDPLFQ